MNRRSAVVTKEQTLKGMAAPFRIPKAAELVARQLRNQIIRGELKEGDSLAPEAELVTMFGVSRPTLREAVRILESEGLISISRGARGGARIHRPDISVATRYMGFILQVSGTTLADVNRMRIIAEPAAARILAETHSKTAPADLRACIEQCRVHFDDDAQYGLASARFHTRLVELTGVQTLILVMEMLNGILEKHLAAVASNAGRQIDNSPGKRKALNASERLVDLIAKGDGPATEAYWRDHLVITDRTMRRWQPAERVIDLLDN